MALTLASTTTSLVSPTILPPSELDITNDYSIRNVAGTLAYDTMAYYRGNKSTNQVDIGDLYHPYYWWVAGALWGTLLDYYHYTLDPSYNDVVLQALLNPTNVGTNHDYMPKEHELEEGNDDLFFWGSAVLSAAERNFPQPDESMPSWLDLGANVFNSLASRWNASACGGGVLWQIYPSNPNGMNYRNSVSNGGFFQLAARLARATGNDTYLDWANRLWTWSSDIGLIDANSHHVYDGVDSSNNCTKVNKQSYTYTSGIYLYGAAIMANHTGDKQWETRAENLLEGALWFFTPNGNSNDSFVLYEAACEKVNRCNADMTTLKGYLSRFMWHSVKLLPALRDRVEQLLHPSIKAAVKSCSGGQTGRACGMRWYLDGYDNKPGLGQQMCALETVQGLLLDEAPLPLKGDEIKVVRDTKWVPLGNRTSTSSSSSSTSTTGTTTTGGTTTTEEPSVTPTESEEAAPLVRVDVQWMSLSTLLAMLFLWMG
ncbi:hypothetical protein DCS_03377 [Drechmeria coniospora]|uniref:Mannan endo-1,6-alpha-mannosidase n=1 Tax=Drechmeria coniospora TaxID=98403 RepID=A0A151GGZ2_DRECN|nr:hypothetical protein DCS_03377 [Drechmeria coniospora]KYK56377.1 hypothetical protein DCS_03377 [Drechmeria coniospora]